MNWDKEADVVIIGSGTGLGLSIVKHGAMMHRARIEVTSTVGKGSRFVIHFPDQL